MLVRAEPIGDTTTIVAELRRLLVIGFCRAIVVGTVIAVIFRNEPLAGRTLWDSGSCCRYLPRV